MSEATNGKTTIPAEAPIPTESGLPKDHRYKYSPGTIERILNLKVDGHTYERLSREFNIPATTLYSWRDREVRQATELGKRLCQSISSKHRDEKDAAETIQFPGGSTYQSGANGRAVLVPESQPKTCPDSSSDEDLVDEIFDELALKIGRQMIEITSLKIRLKRKSKKP